MRFTSWASGTEFPAGQNSQLCHDKTAWWYRKENWRENALSVRTVWIKRASPYRRLAPVSLTDVLKARILIIPKFHTQTENVCVCVGGGGGTPFTKPRRFEFHTHLLPFEHNRWKSSVLATIVHLQRITNAKVLGCLRKEWQASIWTYDIRSIRKLHKAAAQEGTSWFVLSTTYH